MQTRTKFRCRSSEKGVVILDPVTSGSKENEAFFASTPGGQITLSIESAETAAQFVEGDEYYVDFTPAA